MGNLPDIDKAQTTFFNFNMISDDQQKQKIMSLVDVDKADRVQICNNIELFKRFCSEAHRLVDRGRTHYSARTITEYLRHHSFFEDNDSNFKINDHIIPKLSRVSMALFPALNGLFELRGGK